MKDILGRELKVGDMVAHLTCVSTRIHAHVGIVAEFVDVAMNYNYMPDTKAVIVNWVRTSEPKSSKPILGRNLLIMRGDGFDV